MTFEHDIAFKIKLNFLYAHHHHDKSTGDVVMMISEDNSTREDGTILSTILVQQRIFCYGMMMTRSVCAAA